MNCIPVQPYEPFCAADRAGFEEAVQHSLRRFGLRCKVSRVNSAWGSHKVELQEAHLGAHVVSFLRLRSAKKPPKIDCLGLDRGSLRALD
jgi:hypothetical protein